MVVLISASSARAQTPRRIIIDTDPGTDDAMAIMLALNSPEVRVEAMTVVPGNVTGEQGLENALRMVSLVGRCDVPVAAGARHPLTQRLVTAEFVHGQNGLGEIQLPASKCKADPRFAADLIIELVKKSPGDITLVPIGPLTNIALAISKDPSIIPMVKEVIIMGGTVTEGNVTAVAEANIYGDPEAAQVVFNAGWPLTMVGLDVTNKTVFNKSHLDELKKTHGTVNDFAAQVMAFLIELSAKFGADGTPMHDPLAMGVTIDPTLVKTRNMHVDVETRGEFTRGQTVGNRNNMVEKNVLQGDRYVMVGVEPVQPNCKVAVEVEADRFLRLFLDRLRGK
jgi:inosine-uridine nucleoside N-ribohydrolase